MPLLGGPKITAEVSKFSAEPVIFQNETLDEAYASRASYAAPDWELAGWVSTYTAIAAGAFDVVTAHVERLAGHPPINVPEFLSRNAQR